MVRDLLNVIEETQAQSLKHVKDRIRDEDEATLSSPISLSKLELAMKDMAVGKSPGPDGKTLDFYRVFWDLICKDYHAMIVESVSLGQLPSGVTKWMIALLHKGGQRTSLTN